jgi:hypothetical protein
MTDRTSLTVAALVGASMLLVGCPDPNPHPTHPTKADCKITIETTFTATFVTGRQPGGTAARPAPDPCASPNGTGIGGMEWTQSDEMSFSACVAQGTPADRAGAYCRAYMASHPLVGAGGVVFPRPPSFGRLCPGTQRVLSQRVFGSGGTPTLSENMCHEGTTWPLLP